MKQSSKTAVCGMVTALSVVIMLLTVIPVFTYAAPAFAGILLMIIVIEINKKWAFSVYVAAGILSLLLATDKEAAVMYVAFFGYYPIVKAVIENKFKGIIEWIIKFLIFNITMIAAYFVMIKIFGLSMEDMNELGKYGPLILLALGNVVFYVFDLAITRLVTLYILKWQKSFRKLFK